MLILWTFILGCVVAGAATLYCHYSYPTPLSRDVVPSRNNFGSYYVPKRDIYDGLNNFAAAKASPNPKFPAKPHNSWTWMGIGFGITGVLEFGAKRFGGWPLLPVGFVASYGAFIGNAWFSIFIGRAVKSLVVRFGGTQLSMRTQSILVGLILGEALAAAAFLLLNAILVAKGYPSHNVMFLAWTARSRAPAARSCDCRRTRSDFNPIEMAISKTKRLLRSPAERTVNGLFNDIGDVLRQVTPDDVIAFITDCG